MAQLERRLVLGAIPLILGLFWAAPAPAAERIIHVCASCATRTITSGIKAAGPGSIISVEPGTYLESEIIVDKPVRILSSSESRKPVVDAGGKKNVFLVLSSGVEISGFVIRGSGNSYTEEFSGIRAKAGNCRFSRNELEGNTYGIYLADVKKCVLEKNKIRSESVSEASSGNGIHLWKSEEIQVNGNEIRGHRDGIYLEFVHNSQVNGNTSSGNLRYGLHFMFSHNNHYQDNLFSENGSGVAVMYSKEIRMLNNTFSGSKGPASYGILLKDISQGDIRGNRFTDNTVGAYIEGTTRTVFSGNIFSGNGWAMRVLGDTDDIAFVQNDFIGNTFAVSTNASRSLNTFSGNYWSKYRGLDLNRDGTGDDPHYPVQFSSLLMERYGFSVLLLRSFFFSMLDEMESYFPSFVPSSYRDDNPRMKPLEKP